MEAVTTKKMNKTELKQLAQDTLMSALEVAFLRIRDNQINQELTKEQIEEMAQEASRQMERIEKLFGYNVGSWGRG